jgi:hypothetical protein
MEEILGRFWADEKVDIDNGHKEDCKRRIYIGGVFTGRNYIASREHCVERVKQIRLQHSPNFSPLFLAWVMLRP